jgi:NADH:ubiquinone oxidoreductase subunit 2 (subunit N)
MAYSSITHLGWIRSLIIITRPLFSLIYLFFYSLLITPLFIIIHKLNIINNYQLNNFKTSIFISLIIPLLIISLGGLPPLTGFIPKWISITLLWPIIKPVLVILIIGSIINLFFYLNLSFNFILQTESNIKSPSIIKNYSMLSIVSLILLFIPLFILKYALTIFN